MGNPLTLVPRGCTVGSDEGEPGAWMKDLLPTSRASLDAASGRVWASPTARKAGK